MLDPVAGVGPPEKVLNLTSDRRKVTSDFYHLEKPYPATPITPLVKLQGTLKTEQSSLTTPVSSMTQRIPPATTASGDASGSQGMRSGIHKCRGRLQTRDRDSLRISSCSRQAWIGSQHIGELSILPETSQL